MQTHLPQRCVIRLSGQDCDPFLQGIITQDIGLLATQPLIFSAMLSPQGKFLHDFFIFADGDARLIDIDVAYKDAFLKKLKIYKLRSKVSIEETDLSLQAAWDEAPQDEGWMADPRHEGLGWRRVISSSPRNEVRRKSKRESRPASPLDPGFRGDDATQKYEKHRLSLSIPDGAVDGSERHFLLELGYDQLSGVSFSKGCYVGQEPTARMHYRNVLRKGLFSVRAANDETLPEAGTPIMAGDKALGEMRSSCGAIGLAFCRMEPVQTAWQAAQEIQAGEHTITLQIPSYMLDKWALIQQQ